jgi:cytochrome c oxidase subunit 4
MKSHGARLGAALFALLCLTGLSWGLAHAPLGALHSTVALTIAAIKASIVAFVFMEITHGSTTPRWILLTTVLFIALLAAGMSADVALR